MIDTDLFCQILSISTNYGDQLWRKEVAERHTGIPGLWTQVLNPGRWSLYAGPWTLESER